jgi:hypothetical protein
LTFLGIALGLVGSDVSGITPAVSTVHTDGWYGYLPLRTAAYQHRISNQKGPSGAGFRVAATHPSDLFAFEALVVGTAPGICRRTSSGLSKNEFAFRFNRRKSRSRGKLFYHLVQQGRRNRTDNLQKDCGLGHQTEIAQTQPIGGT